MRCWCGGSLMWRVIKAFWTTSEWRYLEVKLVVVIKDVASNKVLERWQFDVESDKSIMDTTSEWCYAAAGGSKIGHL